MPCSGARCGTRRKVALGAARFSAGLEFGGKFSVPQIVTINKSASYGSQWNRIRVMYHHWDQLQFHEIFVFIKNILLKFSPSRSII